MGTDKQSEKADPLFPDLSCEADDNDVSEIESLCLSCYKQVQYSVMCVIKIVFNAFNNEEGFFVITGFYLM